MPYINFRGERGGLLSFTSSCTFTLLFSGCSAKCYNKWRRRNIWLFHNNEIRDKTRQLSIINWLYCNWKSWFDIPKFMDATAWTACRPRNSTSGRRVPSSFTRDYKIRQITHSITRDSTTKLHFFILTKSYLKIKREGGKFRRLGTWALTCATADDEVEIIYIINRFFQV